MHLKEIDIISLGCSKNLVDVEGLMYALERMGYTCVFESKKPQGEIAIINTCGFIGDAKEESIQTILQFAQRKQKKSLKKLYVMGCLSERYLHELEEEIPEVDKWYGKFNYYDLLQELSKDCICCTPSFRRKLTTPSHYTYLKISEGCNRFCSYCAIPLITGRHQSRAMEDIVEEVKYLVGKGVKEFNVIAQDLSSYGVDLYKEHRLPQLIDTIAQIEGVEWIRLHYTYPSDFPEELLDVISKHDNVCNYLDIALQHCTDHMLTIMRRHITSEEQDKLIRRIRAKVPNICLRTTLMVGHPGETEEDFEKLKEWVRTMRFERMGAFIYSEEEGTYAAKNYTDDIPTKTKERRLDELMQIQQEISTEILSKMVGTKQKVIIDREEDSFYVGRTQYDSPDVDCEVLITKVPNIEIGKFYDVTITKADEFDLYATL
ncbi:MAG: 30S ribosomal protein S12 methylthiotransferase RimO [Paludibacteraceae bacterium]|nr:30S ribosomal protein S12 methylthiotransferase RimO [Paludibacteraceae bacterium]